LVTLLLAFAQILDCADGQMARRYKMGSEFGAWYVRARESERRGHAEEGADVGGTLAAERGCGEGAGKELYHCYGLLR
jgi:hypothetical protein